MNRSHYNPTPSQRRELKEAQAAHHAALKQKREDRADFAANALIDRARRAPIAATGCWVL